MGEMNDKIIIMPWKFMNKNKSVMLEKNTDTAIYSWRESA
jgi:hypothetical protein